MKKLLSVICLLGVLATVVLLVGCDCNGCQGCKGCQGDAVPDHVLASVPEVDGYTLYLPEEWTYTRTDTMIVASVSRLSTMSFTAGWVDTAHETMAAYWAESEAELRTLAPDFAPVTDNYGKETKVDGHTAFIYEYTGTFPSRVTSYRFLQYVILAGEKPSDGMVVLTMSGSDVVKESTGRKDFNDDMREKFDRMLHPDAFKLNGKPTAQPKPDISVSDEETPAGMKNATKNEHLGMTVYVPDTWRVDVSDGFIGAVAPDDKGNVGITTMTFANNQASLTERMEHYGVEYYNEDDGFTMIDYWNLTKAEYRTYFEGSGETESFRVILEPTFKDEKNEEGKTVTVCDPPATKAGATTYYTFRFAGTRAGKDFEISLYIFRATEDRQNTFRTLTYTTLAGEHDACLADVEKILKEVRY